MDEQAYYEQFTGEGGDDAVLNWTAQDDDSGDMFCFSPDGRWWFSIRAHLPTWLLRIYQMPTSINDIAVFDDGFDSLEKAVWFAETWAKDHTTGGA